MMKTTGMRPFALVRALCAFAFASGTSVAAADTIRLEPGTQRAVGSSRTIERIAVGDPAVAGVNAVGGRSVLVTGKALGHTTLLVWTRGSAQPVSHDVVVEPQGMALMSSLKIANLGETRVMRGGADSLEEHALTRELAAAGDKQPVDATQSAFDSQVQINIKIVEVSRSRLLSAGVFLGRNQNGNVLSVSGPGGLSSIENSGTGFTLNSASGFLPRGDAFNLVLGNTGAGLLTALSMLESNGFAYTLATPTLSVMSGQSASFLAGGELPIPTRSGGTADNGISIQYREFGVKLQVAATVLDRNRIALKVAPEVSEPDSSLSVATGGVEVPGFVVRKSDTTLMLGDGESFVIGGLFSRNVGNMVDKFPGLAEIPVLGAFFRSKKFDSRDKELLMVVTAHLVKPVAADATLPAMPGEQYRNYNPDYGKFVLDSDVVGDNHLPLGMSE